MTNKCARLLQTEKAVKIGQTSAPEFLLLYQNAVLLALRERGAINDLQLQLCLDRLGTSAHSQSAAASAMLPAKGAESC